MFLSLLLLVSFFHQEIPADFYQFDPALKKISEIKISPFRGEPYIFEVTQPFLPLNEKNLTLFSITHKGNIPFPPNINYYSILQNVSFQENVMPPPYLAGDIYFKFSPSPIFLSATNRFPFYLTVKKFNKDIPFSQILIFRDKSENENMQFTFGRNITKYARFNIAADYLEQSYKTKRSFGFDTDIKLPFETYSHFLFINIKDETSAYPFEDKLMSFSVSRKEGLVRLFKKTVKGREEMGIISDIYLRLPYQRITLGFDYPNFDSTYFRALLIDIVNPVPLLYIVPRFIIDANKEYSASLGMGYHPLVDLFVYGNILMNKDKEIYSSIGLRAKSEKFRLEGFIFSKNEEPEDNSGLVLFYNGEFLTDFYLFSYILAKLKGNNFIFIQPLYQKSFMNGKLKPGIFSGIEYNGEETFINAGILIEIIDVDLYFVFDDINDNELRQYKFGVRWDFFN